MIRIERALLCLAWTGLLVGCGGGGDGSGPAPAAPPGASRQVADVTGAAAPLFAEVFRGFVGQEISPLDEFVATVRGGDLPSDPLANAERTINCTGGGSVALTVTGSGTDITYQYSQCVEQGLTLNGRFALQFTNVNAVSGTYDYRGTYTGFSVRSNSSPQSQTLNGVVTVHTEIIIDAHVHRLVIDETVELNSATYTAQGLAVTLRHRRGDYDTIQVTAAAGALTIAGRGAVDLDYRTATGEVRFSGQASEALLLLDGKGYGLKYKDSQGKDQHVLVDAADIWRLAVLNGRNDAPVLDFVSDLTLDTGQSYRLDLRDRVFDPDLDPVTISLSIQSASVGQHLGITEAGYGLYDIVGGDSGQFTMRVAATDPAGAVGTQTFVVTVIGDADRDGLSDPYDPDDDNDGVADTADIFPFDPTESQDADLDGIGDNRDPDDDNDGVADAQDAFPLDPRCSSASDGTGTQCFVAAIKGFDDLFVVNGVLHFVRRGDKTVYRYDSGASTFLPTWTLGSASPSSAFVTSAAYVPAHDRLYFGYSNGAITSVRPQLGAEQPFTSLPTRVDGLASAGNFLVAQDGSGAWGTHYVFSANAALRWSGDWNYYSRTYAFNPAENRLYFFRDNMSPNDLHFEQFDPSTGALLAAGETPYHGAYGIEPPIVIAPQGDLILLGSGNFFNAGSLTWAGALGSGLRAAEWDATDGLIELREVGGRTSLVRHDAALQIVEQVRYDGIPRAIAKIAQGYVVVTEDADSASLHVYRPTDDSDGDGVLNTVDAFPADIAASIDTDGDGYPDSWNGGRTQADSTTGLVLDAYPLEAACYLPEHGDGTTCDVSSTIPSYLPARVVGDNDGIVYLLNSADSKIYRYSAVTSAHLSPVRVGSIATSNGEAPTTMEYSPQHERLYLGYASGAVTYIDLTEARLRERPFANVAAGVGGLGAAGEYLAVQDGSGAWGSHYYFDGDGMLRSSADWNYYSRDYEWNATLRRLFFFRHDQSPNDLHFEQIGAGGTIDGNGETPYHGDYEFSEPIVMSPNDQYVLIGSGNIFRAADLTWYRSLQTKFAAAVWDDNGTITAVESSGGWSIIHRYDANQVWLGEESRVGEPLALLEFSGGYLLVTYDGAKPVFSTVSR